MQPTIISFKEIDSTNDYLKIHAYDLPHLTIVFTDFQRKGRGQFDHVWISNKGENILCSLLIKNVDNLNPHHIKDELIKLLKVFFQSFDIHTLFKEPNDLYVNHEKICGILIESKYSDKHLEYIVVGLGININQVSFGDLQATSMKRINNQTYDLDKVKQRLIQCLSQSFN